MRILSLVAGVLLMFVAVAMVASRVVRPLAFVLGAPGARFGGAAGKLARQNAVRNPSRTASTAAAVMIGLALITFVAVLGQGVRTSFTERGRRAVRRRLLRVGRQRPPLTNKAAQAVAKAPGVLAVSEIRAGDAKIAGKSIRVNGVDGEPDEGGRHDVVERLRQHSLRGWARTARSSRSATPRTTRSPSARP